MPPGSGRRPAVVFVHGSGGDRNELLGQAAELAARNVLALTITAPSHSVVSSPSTLGGLLAQARSLLLEDGRRDEVVPRAALLNVVHAAPSGTAVKWYDAPHALTAQAYRDAFAWLATKLPIDR